MVSLEKETVIKFRLLFFWKRGKRWKRKTEKPDVGRYGITGKR